MYYLNFLCLFAIHYCLGSAGTKTAELATDHVELAQAHPGIILFAS